jgi:hypothetical protein
MVMFFQNNSSLEFIFHAFYHSSSNFATLCFNRSVWRKSFLTSKVRINALSQRGRPPMLPSVLHCCTVSVPHLIWFQKYVPMQFHLLCYFQQRHFSFFTNLNLNLWLLLKPNVRDGLLNFGWDKNWAKFVFIFAQEIVHNFCSRQKQNEYFSYFGPNSTNNLFTKIL